MSGGKCNSSKRKSYISCAPIKISASSGNLHRVSWVMTAKFLTTSLLMYKVIFIECKTVKFRNNKYFIWTIYVHLMHNCRLLMFVTNFIIFIPFWSNIPKAKIWSYFNGLSTFEPQKSASSGISQILSQPKIMLIILLLNALYLICHINNRLKYLRIQNLHCLIITL